MAELPARPVDGNNTTPLPKKIASKRPLLRALLADFGLGFGVGSTGTILAQASRALLVSDKLTINSDLLTRVLTETPLSAGACSAGAWRSSTPPLAFLWSLDCSANTEVQWLVL